MIDISAHRDFIVAFRLLATLWPLDEDWEKENFPFRGLYRSEVLPWTEEKIFSFRNYVSENPDKRDVFRAVIRMCGLCALQSMFDALQEENKIF